MAITVNRQNNQPTQANITLNRQIVAVTISQYLSIVISSNHYHCWHLQVIWQQPKLGIHQNGGRSLYLDQLGRIMWTPSVEVTSATNMATLSLTLAVSLASSFRLFMNESCCASQRLIESDQISMIHAAHLQPWCGQQTSIKITSSDINQGLLRPRLAGGALNITVHGDVRPLVRPF